MATAGGSSPQPFEPAAESASDTAVEEALGMWTITARSAGLTTVVDTSSSMAEPVHGRRGGAGDREDEAVAIATVRRRARTRGPVAPAPCSSGKL